MKKIFFILIFLFFLIFPSLGQCATLQDGELKQACLDYPLDVGINFYTSYGKLEYNTSYTKQQLTQMGRNIGMFEEGDLASGLALVDVASEYALSTAARKMSNDAVCVIPQEIDIYIGYQNPVIYLARDLQPGSCTYNLVVRHEQVHQQINIAALEYFIPLIYEQIKTIVRNIRPLYLPPQGDTKAATNEMTAFYAQKINLLVDEFKQKILDEQRKLDNREQYQLESEVCQYYNNRH